MESQSQHSHPSEDYDLEQSGSLTDSRSSDDEAWCAGDGICQRETQFQSCYQASLDSWNQAASSHDGPINSLDMHLKAFLILNLRAGAPLLLIISRHRHSRLHINPAKNNFKLQMVVPFDR